MNERVRITGFIAAFMLAFAASPVIAAPASDDAQAVDKMRATIAANAQKLLDQQGGSRILFKVDADALHEAMVTDLRDQVFKRLHDDRIPFADLAVRQGSVEVRITDAKNQQKLMSRLAPSKAAVAATDGGDGLMKLSPTESGFAARLHELVRQSIEMIEQGLRNDGIAQAGLQADGPDRISMLLPGVTDPDRVAAMFNRRSRVAFRLVDVSMTAGPSPSSSTTVCFRRR